MTKAIWSFLLKNRYLVPLRAIVESVYELNNPTLDAETRKFFRASFRYQWQQVHPKWHRALVPLWDALRLKLETEKRDLVLSLLRLPPKGNGTVFEVYGVTLLIPRKKRDKKARGKVSKSPSQIFTGVFSAK